MNRDAPSTTRVLCDMMMMRGVFRTVPDENDERERAAAGPPASDRLVLSRLPMFGRRSRPLEFCIRSGETAPTEVEQASAPVPLCLKQQQPRRPSSAVHAHNGE